MPRPPKTTLIPSSGFDGEQGSPAGPAADGPLPVPASIANLPPAAEPAPSVSFAPPMEVEAQHPVAAPSPMVPMADAFQIQQQLEAMRKQMERLHAENEQLRVNNEQLAVTAEVALTRPTAAPPEPIAPPQTEHKLYFIGQRVEPANNGVPAHAVLDLRGGVHTCARFEAPITFGASREDQYPHAYITKGKGDWLIANDCAKDAYGNPAEIRYRWSPEAQREFAMADLPPVPQAV